MKLKITETAWGIHRAAGGYRERVTANVCFPCVVGAVPPFGNGRRRFTIDAVKTNGICLSVHCVDSQYDRSWNIEKGEEIVYRPRSFDGGYFYTFKLV